MSRTTVLSILAALLLLASPTLAGDYWIVPGVRIGEVSLGMTRSEVQRVLLSPRFTRRLKDGIVEESWISPVRHPSDDSYPWKYNFVDVYYRAGRVCQVAVNSPLFKTLGGLSVESPAKKFERQYHPYLSSNEKNGQPLLYPNPNPGGLPAAKHFVTIEDAVKDGIAWRYGAWGDLAPDPDPSCEEIIIVHRRGQRVLREPDAGLRFVVRSELSSVHGQ